VTQAVGHYGEPNSPIRRRLLNDLKELQMVQPVADLPNLADSLRAARSLLAGIDAEPAPALPQAADSHSGEPVADAANPGEGDQAAASQNDASQNGVPQNGV